MSEKSSRSTASGLIRFAPANVKKRRVPVKRSCRPAASRVFLIRAEKESCAKGGNNIAWMQRCSHAMFSHQTGYPIKIPSDENKLSPLKIAGPRSGSFPVRTRATHMTHSTNASGGSFCQRDVITRASSAYLRLASPI